jgi:hypothetical protein
MVSNETEVAVDTKLVVSVTALRKNPTYINYYVNWFTVLVTGVIPMVLLVFLNVNIYRKIGQTRKKGLTSSSRVQQNGQHRDKRQKWNCDGATSVIENEVLNVTRDAAFVLTPASLLNKKKQNQDVSKKDIKMAITLLTIVLVFFFCHLPR